MNKKEKNLKKVYKARAAHLKWVNSIKLLVSGMTIEKKTLPPLLQNSEFGKWFYYEAMQFSQFNSKLVLDEMEQILESMYTIYANIYTIYFGERSALKSLFGFKSSANKYELELASRYYEDILALSDQFKNKFRVFESQITALSEEKHELIKSFDDEEQSSESIIEGGDDLANYQFGPRSR